MYVRICQYAHCQSMCKYISMSMCQSMANMSICLYIRVYASMSGYLYMRVCQYVHMSVCVSMSVCPSIRVWFKPSEGPLTLRSCLHTHCPALTFPDGKVITLGRGYIKALVPIFVHLAPTGHVLCGYNSVYKGQAKGSSPLKKSLVHSSPGARTRLLLTLKEPWWPLFN